MTRLESHSPGETPDQAGGPDISPAVRLDSWKAIADYLHRNVATVRRWEKQGLPVHRIAGGRGKSVFAFQSEIEAWLRTSPAVDDEAPPKENEPATRSRRLGLWIGLVAAASVAALGLSRSGGWSMAAARVVERVAISADAIEALDAEGRVAWRHDLDPRRRAVPSDTDDAGRVLRGAASGVYAATSMEFARATNQVEGGALYTFALDGTPRWSFRAHDVVVFGGKNYGPPWALTSFAVEDSAAPRTAVAVHHNNWNPSLVAVLDGAGRRLGTFAQSGWIEQLRWLGPHRLLLAGFSNAHDGGMVGLLDPASLDGRGPEQPGSDHHCDSCGRGLPIRVVVMPRSEVNLASHSRFNRASALELTPTRVVVHTIEVPSVGQEDVDALYEFTPELVLVSARFSERYWEIHRALQARGTLNHSPEDCPDRLGPRVMKVWEPDSDWREIRIR